MQKGIIRFIFSFLFLFQIVFRNPLTAVFFNKGILSSDRSPRIDNVIAIFPRAETEKRLRESLRERA